MMAPPNRPLRSEIRATVVVVVLAVAGVIALWPRTAEPGGPPTQASGQSSAVQPAPDDAALVDARARAALQPCPVVTATPDAVPSGPLVGIGVPCLGAPGMVDLAAALAGRTALLNVWASWCEPCRTELPVLAEYARRPGAIQVIGVNVQDAPDAALGLLSSVGVRLPSVTDPGGALHAALQLPPALPVSYLLMADGSVRRIDPPTPFRSADDVAAALVRYQVVPG